MIRLIAAIDQKRGIARSGKQPWKIPADDKYFREQTLKYGAIILRGRKEYEVFGHPFPNRRNIILSNSIESIEGAEVVQDLELLNVLSNVWVIGGEEVYNQTLAMADELYLTHVEADFGCDKFFPAYEDQFTQTWCSDIMEDNGFRFWYEILKPIAKS